MQIGKISRDECLRILAEVRLARLGCARENQPYVVPVYLAYHEPTGCLYGFTTPGQKIEWMRANPLICVEADQVEAYDRWTSVIVFGRFEELPEIPGSDDDRLLAWEVLKTLPSWWQPGSAAREARPRDGVTEPFVSVYYRIYIDQVTGHRASPD